MASSELGDNAVKPTNTVPSWNFWDDPEIAGEFEYVAEPDGGDEEFDYELELKRQEEALMEKYGVQSGGAGFVLSSQVIEAGLSIIGRVVDSALMAYLKFDGSSKNLSDIKALETYTHLRTIILRDNKLSALEHLKRMKFLNVLNAQGNVIESLDAVPLIKFKWIQALNLAHNKLKSLEGICSNTLVYLHLGGNSINSVEFFKSDIFPCLLSLELRGNKLDSIEGIDLPKLRQLYLAENYLRDLSEINGCPSLERLHARQNRIRSLSIWPTLDNLEYLNLRGNRISKFTETIQLENCPNLKTLVLTGNPICRSERYRNEMLAACTSLKRLDKQILNEVETTEGLLIRTKRQNGILPPVEDDPAVAVNLEVEDVGESEPVESTDPPNPAITAE